jgi:hypothetical protein
LPTISCPTSSFPEPHCTSLWTKRPGENQRLNVGDVKHRTHPVPIAYVGNDIEVNLSSLYCGNRGIKGAFWANFLSAAHIDLLGGEDTLQPQLAGMRVERLQHGGLLIVATDTPLPDDTEETRSSFLRLDEALRPAFLSREAISANKRGMLGYFYRERPPLR